MSVLKIQNLTKAYSDTCGIFNFNIDVENNDIILLLGPNGAGKTTAFKGILGLTKVTYEKATILSEDIVENPLSCLMNTGAMVSRPVFYEYLTGYENLKINEPFYKNVDEAKINRTLSDVGLMEGKDKLVSSYSTGMKQRLDLARAIIHEPKLLILDEPFSGMDIEAKFELKNCLKALQNKNQSGIVISSHMVGDLENFANKVIIIYQGNTLYNGSMEHIKESGLTLEAFYLEKLSVYKRREV